MTDLRMEDFPKCENCGAPLVPDGIGPVWVVTVPEEGYPRVRDEGGKCVLCGGPIWAGSDDEDAP